MISKTGKRGEIVDAAATVSTGAGDAIAESLADAVARVRAAISTGNQLDADALAIPRSLRGLCVRMVIRALKDRIQLPLTEDERAQRTEDGSYLNRIADQKMRFEEPDNPAGSAEMQRRGGETAGKPDPRLATRRRMKGL